MNVVATGAGVSSRSRARPRADLQPASSSTDDDSRSRCGGIARAQASTSKRGSLAAARREPRDDPARSSSRPATRASCARLRAILARHPLRSCRGLDEFGAEVDAFPKRATDYAPNASAEGRVRSPRDSRRVPALADDSGLEVDALGGAPGPLSARFRRTRWRITTRERCASARAAAPRSARSPARRALRLHRRARGPRVRARVTARGECPREHPAEAPRGEGGFGYDPVFEVAPGVAMAELPAERKNAVSHRGRALAALRDALAG